MSPLPKIVIQTDADFTPNGKRTARAANFYGNQHQIRWYVSGRVYRKLPVNQANVAMTGEWLKAEKQ